MTELTVVIPTHDRPTLLRNAVASVLGQVGDDAEIIVVDDASAPEHADAIAEICDDPRVRLIRNEVSRYAPHARNQGLREARGRYWCSVDDDDEWLPGKWAPQRAILERHGFPDDLVVVSGFRATLERGRIEEVLPEVSEPERLDSLSRLFARVPISAFSYTFVAPTELVRSMGGWDEELVWGEYTDFLIRLAKVARFAGDRRIAAQANRWHEQVEGRIGRNWSIKAEGIRGLLDKHRDDFRLSPDVRGQYLHVLGVIQLRAGDRREARRSFAQVVRSGPGLRRRARALGHLLAVTIGGRRLWRRLALARGKPAETLE